MKKFLTLMLAAGMMFSAANSASAIEYKVSGTMDFTFETFGNAHPGGQFMSDGDYRHNNAEYRVDNPNTWWLGDGGRSYQKRHTAVQRMRIGVEIIASESLSAYYEAQVGTFTWGGEDGSGETRGGRLGGRSNNITTNKAYLDWLIPCTEVKVRMGLQDLVLPSYAFKNPILDERGTGIVVAIPVTENVTITPLWVRVESDSARANANNLTVDRDDLMDVFGLVSDFRFNGWAASLYGVYATNGKDARGGDMFPIWADSGHSAMTSYMSPLNPAFTAANAFTGTRLRGDGDMWGVGLGMELTMFDPFRFSLDAFYGSADNDTTYPAWATPWKYRYFDAPYYDSSMDDRAGWYVALGAEYKASWGTPMLKGWYASGDDDDLGNGSERMPTLDSSWDATTLYHDGMYTLATGNVSGGVAGTWGVQAKIADVSFIDKLSHELSVTYVKGTNHEDNARYYGAATPATYLTKSDSLVEIDFNTTYQIYQNLATVLELSYIIEDFDKGVWGQAYGLPSLWGYEGMYDNAKFSDMWRAAINFRYSF